MSMGTKYLSKTKILNEYENEIINLCFDHKSLRNFSPGLKLVFSTDDMPLFVKIVETESNQSVFADKIQITSQNQRSGLL